MMLVLEHLSPESETVRGSYIADAKDTATAAADAMASTARLPGHAGDIDAETENDATSRLEMRTLRSASLCSHAPNTT